MGSDANSTTSSPSQSPLPAPSSPVRSAAAATPSPSGGKRSRDPEDEVYVDNLHSHKRYLSEIMASSLNGLTVGDSLSDTLMESSSVSDNLFFLRDDMSLQYSPISEDSDDSRYPETPINSCSSQLDSQPTSPVSPYRFQRPLSAFSYGTTTTLSPPHATTFPNATSSQPRQRGSDSEGRFPSSPSDICHSGDLRRTALLRSVHMRTQPFMETEERPFSFMKSLVEEKDNRNEEYSSFDISEGEVNREKSGGDSNVNIKEDEATDRMH